MHQLLKKVSRKLNVSLTNIRFISITKGCPRISGLKVKGRRWQITSIRRKSKHQTISLPFDCIFKARRSLTQTVQARARPSLTWAGLAWLGSAWLSLARLGLARLGSAQLGSARIGSARLDPEQPNELPSQRVDEPLLNYSLN